MSTPRQTAGVDVGADGYGKASPALTPPPGHPRFPLLDSVRALAVISVLLVHAGFVSGAIASAGYWRLLVHLNVGLTVFFVISGFLLYRPFVAARVGGAPRVRVRTYGRRRVLRILPAYLAALTLLTIYPGLYGVTTRPWVFYGFLQSIGPLHTGLECPGGCGIPAAWSLSVEVMFYALLPVYVVFAERVTGSASRRRWLITEVSVLGALAVASVLIDAIWRHDQQSFLTRWFLNPGTLAGTFVWLACGMLLAVASVALTEREAKPRRVLATRAGPFLAWGLALAMYVLLSLWLPISPTPGAYSIAQVVAERLIFAVVAMLVVAPAIFGHGQGAIGTILANRPLRWLGAISYGIFLWHLPLMSELDYRGVGELLPQHRFLSIAIVSFAVSAVFGAASYYLIERPFLRLKDSRLGPMWRFPRTLKTLLARSRGTAAAE